ncbi:phage tail tip lysozyme, partial [Methylobacterium sp. J-070]|uniref:phage tail tip lysozyme n=1 Tax=Methylobacterium sp. J-070 TaxID=2836650 RepID=UPI001FBB7CBA
FAKTRESAVKEGKGIEKSLDSAGDAVERLARNALKLFAIFTAGREIKNFVADITSADAALGRLATRIGSTPEAISGLANAVARNGGSADAAAGSFQKLSDTIMDLKTTGNSGALPWFAKLQGLSGQQIRLNTDLTTTFGDLADAAKGTADRNGAPMANYLLRQAGVDQDTAALLIQGRAKLMEALAKSGKVGLVRKEDAEAAQRLQTSIETLRQTSESFGRAIMTRVTPVIVDLIERFQKWIEANKDWIQSDIVAKLEEFAKALREMPWDEVGKGIRDFIVGANDAAKAVGGWKTVAEAFFGLWVTTKVGAVLAQIGLIRAALVTGNTSLLAAMLRVGLPVAIGAIATGHGYQTPEDAAADPDQAQLQREGIERRGRVRGAVRRGWNAVKRVFGGGEAEAAEGGAGIRMRAARSIGKLARSENVQAIIGELRKAGYNDNAVAATVGSMQTESSFNPRAHNDQSGGHTGLWQWDRNRWPKIKAWIEGQGGNPYDASWQTKAWVAEHTARPGDAIYDHAKTERGGAILKGNPTLEQAIHGVQLSERFGVGEEGGRAAHARQWLPQLQTPAEPTQREKDIATIQAETRNLRAGTPSQRRPDVLADPKDERRQVPSAAPAPSAWNGIPNAGLFVAQAQAAQAAQIANTTNDNRQSSVRTDTTHMHGDVIVNSSASNADGLIGDLKQSLKGRAYAMSSNTGQA